MVEYEGNEAEQSPALPQAPAAQMIDDEGQLIASLPVKHKGAQRAMSPETERKRQERMDKLRAQSSELLQSRKRRRRTRGWSGLPADPPLPPRYPSETTIDECKAFLHLDNDTYQAVRDHFEEICHENDVMKKTIAGPEKWQQVKERLIAENPKVQREFHGPFNGVANEKKELALDVICMDVTKRMRVVSNRMTIAEAKTVLAINPEQSRRVRNHFYEILKADRFISKLDAGEEHWTELKQKWETESDIIAARMLSAEGVLERTPDKLKALDVLARDVQKRLRDEQARADPTYVKQVNAGPGPGPASFQAKRPGSIKGRPLPAISPYEHMSTPASKANKKSQAKRQAPEQRSERIDPSLLAAASDSSNALDQLQHFAASASQTQASLVLPSTAPTTQSQYKFHLPVACLFRLSKSSAVTVSPEVWFGSLPSVSIGEVFSQANRPHPNFSIARLEGMVPGQDDNVGSGFPLSKDDELGAYLDFVAGTGKVVFSVALQ